MAGCRTRGETWDEETQLPRASSWANGLKGSWRGGSGGPSSERRRRTEEDAARPRVASRSRDLGRYGGGMRPGCRSSTGRPGERATQPSEVIAGRRAWKLRPNRVTVVPQAWGKAGGAGRTPTYVSRHPRRSRGSNGSTPGPAHAAGRRLSLRGDHRESAMLDPSGLDPWAAVRRARCSILCSRSRIRGTGTLQVSRQETTGKA